MSEIKCNVQHLWNGNPPFTSQPELEGKPCDCGKMLFHIEGCGCPGNPQKEIKLQENPNYIPQ